ncbi:hypothetical protein [Rhodohalobacter sp.]|uniref:hypothetical protein n=1 Tax=Rhodohalobacter sp. TaxID=1974210 RepID=UPI002ACE1A6C|nr:hypothetical protein [Rhodohalobacter sp.]MDZ7755213.1 hypothetical protein [Rhodohalobacter sp.]
MSSLIGVDDLQGAIDSDSFPQQLGLILFLQAIVKSSVNDKMTVKINDRRQEHDTRFMQVISIT